MERSQYAFTERRDGSIYVDPAKVATCQYRDLDTQAVCGKPRHDVFIVYPQEVIMDLCREHAYGPGVRLIG